MLQAVIKCRRMCGKLYNRLSHLLFPGPARMVIIYYDYTPKLLHVPAVLQRARHTVHVHHHYFYHPYLLIHFTLGSKPTSFTSLSHHRLLAPYPWTAFSDINCFSHLLCSSVCFIFLSLFLFSFWSRVLDYAGYQSVFSQPSIYRVAQKNGASVFYCKYFENSTTELRESWWTSAVLYAERSNYLFV